VSSPEPERHALPLHFEAQVEELPGDVLHDHHVQHGEAIKILNDHLSIHLEQIARGSIPHDKVKPETDLPIIDGIVTARDDLLLQVQPIEQVRLLVYTSVCNASSVPGTLSPY
jgi:hypothetical protein